MIVLVQNSRMCLCNCIKKKKNSLFISKCYLEWLAGKGSVFAGKSQCSQTVHFLSAGECQDVPQAVQVEPEPISRDTETTVTLQCVSQEHKLGLVKHQDGRNKVQKGSLLYTYVQDTNAHSNLKQRSLL